MARKEINVGTSPNKGDGDPLRTAFRKINENFAELYTGNFAEPDVMTSTLAPDTDGIYDLGKSNKRWADLYVKDFIYLNGSRIELTPNGTLLINGGPPAERQDTVGSVFADDSTVMVDGIAGKVVGPVETTTVDATIVTATNLNGLLTGNVVGNVTGDVKGSVFADDSTVIINGTENSINLDGTVKGNIIPDANEAYDIGSMTNKFRDLYLSGSTINLGGLEITNDNGVVTFGGEKVVVEGGTGDVKGSVFGDDSTLLVDAVNSVIPKAVVQDSTNWDTAYSWGDHSAAGYLVQADILDGTLTIDVNNTGDLQGSVFGDDSTLLVDAINSVIPKANVESSADWDTAFAWGDHAMAGYQSATASFTGDVKGSVFADDSTLLVDAVAGKITGDVETTSVAAIGIKASVLDNNGGPLQIKAGLTTDTGNTIFINPYGSNTFIQSQAETHTWLTGPYLDAGPNPSLEFKTAGAFKTLDGAFFEGNLTGNVTGNITGNVTGDVVGSVFADDSTLLVDGANGVIPTSVLQGDITNPIRTGNVVIESTTSPGSVTITHAGIGGIILDASTSVDGISLGGNVNVEGSFTPPMLTQVEIDALTPTLGMMVYNTTTGKFQGYAADANNDSTTGWADLH